MHAEAAGTADRQRRIAPAIEEEHGLLAGGDGLAHRLAKFVADEGARRRSPATKVDEADGGFRRRRIAILEQEMPFPPNLVQAFERGCGTDENERRTFEFAAFARDQPGIVDNPVFLLEARVVRLVHDDETEIGKGQEQGRTGTDEHLDLAAHDGLPGLAPLCLGEAGMPGRRGDAETLPEASEPLRREGDLRQQYEYAAALAQRRLDGFEIDLRLARARHALQQPVISVGSVERRHQPVGGIALRCSQPERLAGKTSGKVEPVGIDLHCLQLSGPDHLPDESAGNTGSPCKRRCLQRAVAGECIRNPAPFLVEPRDVLSGRQAVGGAHGTGFERRRHGDEQARDRSERREGGFRHALGQPPQCRRERRQVEHRLDRP